MSLDIPLADAAATEGLGAALAQRLRPGDAICLYGSLGAGKTTLARGLIRALTGPDQEAPSPTFTLVQLYDGRDFPISHFDLYRLEQASEVEELGLDEALDAAFDLYDIRGSVRLAGPVACRLPAERLRLLNVAAAAGLGPVRARAGVA